MHLSIAETGVEEFASGRGVASIDADLARAKRALYGRRVLPQSGAVRGMSQELRFGPVCAQRCDLGLSLLAQGCEFDLQVVESHALGWPQELLHPDLPARLRLLYFMEVGQPLLALLASALGSRIEVTDVHISSAAWQSETALGVTALATGFAAPAKMLLRARACAGWNALRAFSEHALPATRLASLAVCLRVMSTPMLIEQWELAGLDMGDVLVLDAARSDCNSIDAELCIDGRRLAGWGVIWMRGGFRLEMTVRPHIRNRAGRSTEMSSREEDYAKDYRDADEPDEPSFDGTTDADERESQPCSERAVGPRPRRRRLDAVRLELRVELDRIELTLDELAGLHDGQVFETASSLPHAPVTLWCGEQRIGAGEIVRICDRLAVRVSSICSGVAQVPAIDQGETDPPC